jgi:hypothetical protein
MERWRMTGRYPAYHSHHLFIRIDRNDIDARMSGSEHSEHLVSKRLTDTVDPSEVEDNHTKALEAIHQALGLRTGDKPIVTVLQQLYRNDRPVEPIVIPVGSVLIENLA